MDRSTAANALPVEHDPLGPCGAPAIRLADTWPSDGQGRESRFICVVVNYEIISFKRIQITMEMVSKKYHHLISPWKKNITQNLLSKMDSTGCLSSFIKVNRSNHPTWPHHSVHIAHRAWVFSSFSWAKSPQKSPNPKSLGD